MGAGDDPAEIQGRDDSCLVDMVEAASRKQPSVMLFEDAHWADPSMLEVFDLLIDRVRAMPLLILLTHRPEFQSRWTQHGHVIALTLSKLTRAQSSAMVLKVASARSCRRTCSNRSSPRPTGSALRGRAD